VLFSGITLANLRRRLWPDTATMCRELMRGAEVADVLLLSFEDKSGFVGDVTPKATIPRYRARGARSGGGRRSGPRLDCRAYRPPGTRPDTGELLP
jgi:hypothetical protein